MLPIGSVGLVVVSGIADQYIQFHSSTFLLGFMTLIVAKRVDMITIRKYIVAPCGSTIAFTSTYSLQGT